MQVSFGFHKKPVEKPVVAPADAKAEKKEEKVTSPITAAKPEVKELPKTATKQWEA